MELFTKYDILMAGLILISVLVHYVTPLQSYLIKSVKSKGVTVLSSVLSISFIYNFSFSSNNWGLLILAVSFIVFFYVFACGIAFISKHSKVVGEK